MSNCPECGCVLDDKPRSIASHRNYFAQLHEIYLNLPHRVTDRLNFDQFRKHALIKTGWRDETSHPCATRAEAERWASRLRRLVTDYAIIFIDGNTVTVWTAKSQSMRDMGKIAFRKSRDDVEAYARDLLGSPTSLSQQAA
jgi:hypothetical protein